MYYKAAFWAALGAAVSYAVLGRLGLACGAAALAAAAVALRKQLVPVMQQLGSEIEAKAEGAVQRFRRIHGFALLVNLGQLVLVVCGIIQLSRSA